eukprot:COSAG06_NODE_273_length_18671_cov_15.620201_3_plen_53_part_00
MENYHAWFMVCGRTSPEAVLSLWSVELCLRGDRFVTLSDASESVTKRRELGV